MLVRIGVILIAGHLARKGTRLTRGAGAGVLLLMGLGFLVNSITGSNNETQLAPVFWHETRILHAVLYILGAHFLYTANTRMCVLILSLDLLFSFLYRMAVSYA